MGRIPDMDDRQFPIGDDDPMTLLEACQIVFRGTIKPATLRAEAARGNLVVERIGRRDFVTRAAIQEMRERCRAQQKVPASGLTETQDCGSSEMERRSAALAAALKSARELRKGSGHTSRKSTNRQKKVVRLVSS
ncbi:MAG: hypothetical protein GY789_26975 [Hyphomicrobiales bacterium]|nr:hypothetical protein [Hyphomicrobiales bacterium]MCP5001135.1 hypothetical protein [Hyphomicrobiales bacterium]